MTGGWKGLGDMTAWRGLGDMTGGGEVHVEGARGHDCMEGVRCTWRGLGDMTGGGEVHVEGARGHDCMEGTVKRLAYTPSNIAT